MCSRDLLCMKPFKVSLLWFRCFLCRFDSKHSDNEVTYLECFCVITSGIKENANGSRLKQMMIDKGILFDAINYIKLLAPPIKTLLALVNLSYRFYLQWPMRLFYCCNSAVGVPVRTPMIGRSLWAGPVYHTSSVCSLVHLCNSSLISRTAINWPTYQNHAIFRAVFWACPIPGARRRDYDTYSSQAGTHVVQHTDRLSGWKSDGSSLSERQSQRTGQTCLPPSLLSSLISHICYLGDESNRSCMMHEGVGEWGKKGGMERERKAVSHGHGIHLKTSTQKHICSASRHLLEKLHCANAD